MSSFGNQIESEEAAKKRFQIELEFVQCLANPNYLNFLAQRGYFKDQAFINYLKYLLYWKEPDYAKYLMYPMCLYFLDLLQYEHFRREIANTQCCKFIDDQAILLWQHYTRRRAKLFAMHNGTAQNELEPNSNNNNNNNNNNNHNINNNNNNINSNSNSNSNSNTNNNNINLQQNGVAAPPPPPQNGIASQKVV